MSAFDVQVGGSHYKGAAIQPAEFNIANGLGFAEGNVVKYVFRWQMKGGIEDLEKARHYLDLLIEAKKPRSEIVEDFTFPVDTEQKEELET